MNTFLQSAIKDNDINKVELLMKEGADVNSLGDESGEVPLLCAARFGRVEIFKLLLDHGANINAKNNHGKNLIYRLVASCVGSKIGMESTDNEERKSLLQNTYYNQRKFIALFIKHGANINERDNNLLSLIFEYYDPTHYVIISSIEISLSLHSDLRRIMGDGYDQMNTHGEEELHQVLYLLCVLNYARCIDIKQKVAIDLLPIILLTQYCDNNALDKISNLINHSTAFANYNLLQYLKDHQQQCLNSVEQELYKPSVVLPLSIIAASNIDYDYIDQELTQVVTIDLKLMIKELLVNYNLLQYLKDHQKQFLNSVKQELYKPSVVLPLSIIAASNIDYDYIDQELIQVVTIDLMLMIKELLSITGGSNPHIDKIPSIIDKLSTNIRSVVDELPNNVQSIVKTCINDGKTNVSPLARTLLDTIKQALDVGRDPVHQITDVSGVDQVLQDTHIGH